MKYNQTIHFRNCVLEHRGSYCTTVFPDGTETSNWPQPDEFYKTIAVQCGHNDLMDYCFEHEFFHTFVPLKFFDRESYVTTRSARNILMSESAAKSEERLVYYFQRFFRDHSYPALDWNWPELREEASAMLLT